jgi:hypothetical protein
MRRRPEVGQETTVNRGHEGIRQFVRDVDKVLPQLQVRVLEVRDLGERLVASGRLRGRGRTSGADIAYPPHQIGAQIM